MAPNTIPKILSTPPTPVNNNNSCNSDTEAQKIVKKILYDGHYYDVTDWVKRHPGGRIIDYYTESGEDATLAIQQFHYRSTQRVMGLMKGLKKLGPPIPPSKLEIDKDCITNEQHLLERVKRHADLTHDFTQLHLDLEAEGYFTPSYWHMTYRLLDIIILMTMGLYLIKTSLGWTGNMAGIFLFSLSLGKCGWVQHEGGHGSLTGSPGVDRFIQALAYGLTKGMSSSWWSNQHNRHHAMPNRLKRDVDLDTLPLLAFNAKILEGKGTILKNSRFGQGGVAENKNFFVLNQALLFLTVDTMLVGIFWKFYLHPRYAWKRKNYLDLTLMTLSYFLLYYIGIWNYLATFWTVCLYLFGNFSLSHTHLPVTEGPLHWVEYGLLHTQDIDSKWCPWLVDWWMGYLNCQIEHHLFPTMPQFRNRQIKPRVKALAQKYGIPYLSTSYGEAVWKTFKNLHDVSNHDEKID